MLIDHILKERWPFHPFSLQDSFEYINQDPSLGKLSSNQNALGTCRSGSNLGKYFQVLCLSDNMRPSVCSVCFFSVDHHLPPPSFFALHLLYIAFVS